MKTKEKPKLTLMDATNRALFGKKMMGNQVKGPLENIAKTYRRKLRKAERFTVDDEAVRLVCHLSHERQRLSAWAFLARLPFDTLWLEFDLHEKVREFEKMNKLKERFVASEVPPRLGLLFWKDGDEKQSRWICHEFKEVSPGEVVPGVLAYVFDPEGSEINPVRGSLHWRMPTLSLIPKFPRVLIKPDNGTMDPEYLLCGMFERHGEQWGAPEWFSARCAVIIDPFWWKAHLISKTDQHMIDVAAYETNESSGAVRWIVTLLAAINGLPRDVRPIKTRPGRQLSGAHILPYLGHSNLSITIPRDNRVVWASQILDHSFRNARRRWHPVMGHWRIIERGKSTHMCRHLPTMVEEGVGMCELCQLMIRWIPSHSRGDPNLGIVHQVRTVTT